MARTILENIIIQKFEKVTSLPFCQYTPIRFFEILHIEKGSGIITINNHKVKYNDNQLFILIPNDQYNLEIETTTTISAIKFLNSFFSHYNLNENKLQRKEWFKKIETILHSANRISYLNIQFTTDESSLQSLFTVLCNEYNDENLKNEEVLKSTLHAILHIISRNVNFTISKISSSKIQDIINYIHYTIHQPEKLTNKKLAVQFHISENYISQFFKSKMNIGLKNYILNYKLKLAETRLKYTDLTVTEIAQELGFTDSSHLDKTFLTYKGTSVKTYKNRLKKIN